MNDKKHVVIAFKNACFHDFLTFDFPINKEVCDLQDPNKVIKTKDYIKNG